MEDNFFGNFIYEGNLDHSYYVRLRQETNESKNSWREKEFIMYIINYILRNEWLLSSRFKYNKEYSSICLLFYSSYIILFHKSKWQIPFCLLLFNIMMDVVLMWWLYENKMWSVETSFCVVTGHFVNKWYAMSFRLWNICMANNISVDLSTL